MGQHPWHEPAGPHTHGRQPFAGEHSEGVPLALFLLCIQQLWALLGSNAILVLAPTLSRKCSKGMLFGEWKLVTDACGGRAGERDL
jgi:hypothetical protein